MVQKERASLWRIKHLLTRLSGDNTWIPCESVETENDFSLFLDERDQGHNLLTRAVARDEADHGSTGTMASDDNDPAVRLLTMEPHSTESAEGSGTGKHAANEDASAIQQTGPEHGVPLPNGKTTPENTSKVDQSGALQGHMEVDEESTGGPGKPLSKRLDEAGEGHPTNAEADVMDTETGLEEDLPIPTRMRTRAQAQAASDNTSRPRSPTSEAGDDFIHPYFLAPPSSHLDRNLALPQHEADETRRLLQLYIQKQEEVCRGAEKVYNGLLRADRYRKLVMKWAKAEAHVRDMSDGEDWYDKEEWGLDEDLKKGQDEEEEDAATTAKKTRTRRQ